MVYWQYKPLFKRIVRPLISLVAALAISIGLPMGPLNGTSVAPAALAQGTFTSSSSVSPSVVAPGSTVTINTNVTSASATTILVDVEVYDATGARVGQQFWDNQSFTAGQMRTYPMSRSVPAAADGVYTAKLALFNPGWAQFLQGNMSAATF